MTVILSDRRKKNLSVDIHPSSREAYEFYHALQLRFDKTLLGSTAIKTISKTQIYRAIYLPDDSIGIISGFETIGFSVTNFDLGQSLVLLEKDMTDDQISELSWSCVLRVILSSIDPQTIESIRESLNLQVPESILQTYFNHDSITQKSLSRLTNMSVSGLKKQKKRVKEKFAPQRSKLEFFSMMRREFDDE